jgi:hypothetical protein
MLRGQLLEPLADFIQRLARQDILPRAGPPPIDGPLGRLTHELVRVPRQLERQVLKLGGRQGQEGLRYFPPDFPFRILGQESYKREHHPPRCAMRQGGCQITGQRASLWPGQIVSPAFQLRAGLP